MSLFNRDTPTEKAATMSKEGNGAQPARDSVVSIIGPGMRVVGDCETEGTLRIEGVVEGTVRAGKAVVIGKDGAILGDLLTQDAIIGGKVTGTIIAESRLELQATCLVEGEIRARRIKLDEGGRINGKVHTGDIKLPAPSQPERKKETPAEPRAAQQPAAQPTTAQMQHAMK
jgi:cytoskeletal protein CcmA (bactofilin family)